MTASNPDSRSLTRRQLASGLLVAGAACLPATANAGPALDGEADAALARLYAANAKARELGQRARAVLIFPSIAKAGLLVGGQTGKGVLQTVGEPARYYRITAASYGLQAGAQTYSYALFFMTRSSLDYLHVSDGWSIGTGPSVVFIDEGFARTLNTTTLTQDVYAIAFGQRGLMAGTGLEGAKISPISAP
ncbi:MAG TPA: lipid-binding SYLF domain-containing protein [Caulobacter sp.]|nr:lipid-binding SYLF domain-containing protein [Caulobacter sp.]